MSLVAMTIPMAAAAILGGLGWTAALVSRRNVDAHLSALAQHDEDQEAVDTTISSVAPAPEGFAPMTSESFEAFTGAIKSTKKRYHSHVSGTKREGRWIFVPNAPGMRIASGASIVGPKRIGAGYPKPDPIK